MLIRMLTGTVVIMAALPAWAQLYSDARVEILVTEPQTVPCLGSGGVELQVFSAPPTYRPPYDVVLALDVSRALSEDAGGASVATPRWADVLSPGVVTLIESLQPTGEEGGLLDDTLVDRLGVVLFAGGPGTSNSSVEVPLDTTDALSTIRARFLPGTRPGEYLGTERDLAAALTQAQQLFTTQGRAEAKRALVLLLDGAPTVGGAPQDVCGFASSLAALGVQTLVVGTEIAQDLALAQLSALSGCLGASLYTGADPDELPELTEEAVNAFEASWLFDLELELGDDFLLQSLAANRGTADGTGNTVRWAMTGLEATQPFTTLPPYRLTIGFAHDRDGRVGSAVELLKSGRLLYDKPDNPEVFLPPPPAYPRPTASLNAEVGSCPAGGPGGTPGRNSTQGVPIPTLPPGMLPLLTLLGLGIGWRGSRARPD